MPKTTFDNLVILIKSLFIGLFSWFHLSAHSNVRCVLIACHDTNRYGRVHGKWFSPLLEPIAEYYRTNGYRIVHLSYPPTLDPHANVLGKSIIINDNNLVILLIKAVEQFFFGKERANERAHQRRVKLYKKILYKAKPDLVFSITTPHAMGEASRALNIPLVEAQHGMNISLNTNTFIRKFHYPDMYFPQAFLAFDLETHSTQSTLFSGRPIDSILMPHPWHIETMRSKSKLVLDTSELTLLVSPYQAAVLVSLQWGYDGEVEHLKGIIPNGILHPVFEEAIAQTPIEILWLVRLHPVQLKGYSYRRHRNYIFKLADRYPNVNVDFASYMPLPQLLTHCVGHIAMSSGVCGEAAQLGVPSLMLCPSIKPGGGREGAYSTLPKEYVTYGELATDQVISWVVSKARNGTTGCITDYDTGQIATFERQLNDIRHRWNTKTKMN